MASKVIQAGLAGGAGMALCGVVFASVLALSSSIEVSAAIVVLVAALVAFLLASFLAGILAARGLSTPRAVGGGARTGALAGLIAGATNAAVTVFVVQVIVKPSLSPWNPFSYTGDLRPMFIDAVSRGTLIWVPVAAALCAASGAAFAALRKG